MHDLTEYRENLPATPEDLQTFILIGKESLKAQKAKIRAIEKANMALAAKEAALLDTQDLAEILLDAEAKLGEMLGAANLSSRKRTEDGRLSGAENPLPPGITKKQSHEAQELFRHGWAREQAKKKAREDGTVVTARDVLQKVQEMKLKHTETHPVSDAWHFVEIAIANLECIREDDPEIEGAIIHLMDWIKNHLL